MLKKIEKCDKSPEDLLENGSDRSRLKIADKGTYLAHFFSFVDMYLNLSFLKFV